MAQYKTLNNFANEFSTSTTYNVGDLVMYLGTLYACTTQHTGSWDASHFIQTNFKGTTSSVSVNPTLTGNEPELLGLEVDGNKYQSQKTYASDGVTFRFDAPEGITLENSFSSYNRMGKMVAFVVYCKITKSAGASNVVGIGTFSNLPNDVNDKIVGGTFVLEDKSVVYVDGTYTRVVAPSSWTKESGNRLSLSIDTTNMVNDTTYACRLLSIFLLTDNLLFDTILDNNPWDVIDMAAKAGTASNYWSVGDTKTDVGVDGNTRTFRIVNMDNDGIVFEEVGLEDAVVWNSTTNLDDDNTRNDYYISDIRNIHLPAILLKFSSDLQGLITTTNVKVAKNGGSSTVLTLTDKLFLEAAKELWASPTYSISVENSALTTFQYYQTHTSQADHIKYDSTNTALSWWLRSPASTNNVVLIYGSGSEYRDGPNNTRRIAPCFRLGQPQTGGLGRLFSSYSWQEIDAIAKAGNASSYFAIGDTKTDTGTDSVTRTFRIVDMNERGITMEQVGLEGTDGTGATGVVWDADNVNDYSASDMRNTVLPATLLKYSSNLQAVIAYTDVKVAENGNSTTVLTLNDKLFLEAEKEVFGSLIYGVSQEASELSQLAYYVTHTTNADRIKYDQAGYANSWWLRSPHSGGTDRACDVSSSGGTDYSLASRTYPFSPTFRIGISDTAPARRCVISNLGSEDPTAVTFTKTGGFPIESQAWEEVVIGNDHFAKFTPWYKKTIFNANNEVTGMIISDQQEDADFVPYDCFLDENGNLLPYILIGRYCCSNTTTADSIDNAGATMTIGTGRTLCQAKGTGYQMMDAAMQIFWRDLALACSEKVDFNNGAGVASYLGLARMTEQYWWIDGLAQNNGTYLYSNKPSKYVDNPTTSTDGYSALSYTMPTTNGCITKLGYDANHPTVNCPSANNGSTSAFTTYYCDAFYYSSGSHPCDAYVGDAYASSGLFNLGSYAAWSRAGGIRLCYKPLGGNN